jgi:hypothetical protein
MIELNGRNGRKKTEMKNYDTTHMNSRLSGKLSFLVVEC